MGALTPVPPALGLYRAGTPTFPIQVSPLHAHDLPDHSVSNYPMSRRRSFHTLPLSSTGPPSFGRGKASPFTRRLARFIRPNRVRCSTDWSFTSRCSPPRLTATQLRSITGWKAFCLEWTLTTLFMYAHGRTS